MRLKETFKYDGMSFYSNATDSLTICLYFVEVVLRNTHSIDKINITLATKNPRRAGWTPIIYNGFGNYLTINGTKSAIVVHSVLQNFFVDNHIYPGDTFWVKVEEVK